MRICVSFVFKCMGVRLAIYMYVYMLVYFLFLSFFWGGRVFKYIPFRSNSDSKYIFSKKSDNTLFFYIHLFFVSICTQHVRKKEILYERKNVRQKYLNITFKDKKVRRKKNAVTTDMQSAYAYFKLLSVEDA